MTIARFDRNVAKSLNDEVQAVLNTIAAKHGLKVERGSGRFSESDFSVKYMFKAVSADGVPASFKTDAIRAGVFGEVEYGQKFKTHMGEFKLVGFKPRRSKYPVIGEGADGKKFLFPAVVLKV